MTSELEWLLEVDVKTTIEQLNSVLADCSATICQNLTLNTQHNLFYCNQLDTIKVNMNLEGYKITSADINMKLSSQTIKTCIRDTPWRLYQIQDAHNHLNIAIDTLKSTPASHLELINDVMNSLLKSRSSLLIPKKSSIEELQHCQNMQSISPALPLDYSISFYIQANNLVCSVYHLSQNNKVKNEYQAEVPVPFLSDVLILLSLGLQICQQLKDKIQILQAMV